MTFRYDVPFSPTQVLYIFLEDADEDLLSEEEDPAAVRQKSPWLETDLGFS